MKQLKKTAAVCIVVSFAAFITWRLVVSPYYRWLLLAAVGALITAFLLLWAVETLWSD